MIDNNLLQEWWIQVQQGNSNAFCQLYFHTVNMAGDQAFRIVKDRDKAKDIVQEAYESLFRNRHSVNGSNIAGYLRTTVKHKSLNALKTILLNEEEAALQLSMIAGDREEAADRQSADQVIGHIESVVAGLSTKCRDVFILKYYNQFTYKQIAERLGISVKTVEKHIAKALGILRQELTKEQVTVLILLLLY